MRKLSRGATKALSILRYLRSSVVDFRSEVYAALVERRPPLIAESEMPDFEALSRYLMADFNRAEARVIESDVAVADERTQDRTAYQGRNQARSRLSGHMAAAHKGVDVLFRDGSGLEAEQLGFPTVLPANAEQLLRTASVVPGKLREPTIFIPEAVAEIADAQFGSFASQIETASGELSSALAVVDQERSETDRAVVARDAALADLKRVYVNGGRLFEALCRLAGKDELADKVRRTLRRRSRQNEEPAPGEEAPAAETSVAASI